MFKRQREFAKKELNNYKKLAKELLKGGWTLNDIDEMDIHFYFDLFSVDEKKYIDDIKLF